MDESWMMEGKSVWLGKARLSGAEKVYAVKKKARCDGAYVCDRNEMRHTLMCHL